VDQEDLVEIYRARDSVQAALVQQALQEAGIRAELENLLLTGGTAEIPGWSTNPRIMVEVKDQVAAKRVIEQFEQAEAAGEAAREAGEDVVTCIECGARLQPGVSKCPVCGWSYDQADSSNDA
jgi:D-serine deaminase-like pyridoxal phosphate-dependent protein